MRDYQLHTVAAGDKFTPYQELFCADNHRFTKTSTYLGDEIIFAVQQDGLLVRSYGCTNFIIFAPAGGDMDCEQLGISSGWGGVSCPAQLSKLFADDDARKLFYTEYGIDMKQLMSSDGSAFTRPDSGWKSMKFKNINIDGSAAQHTGFVDTDFPMFRLADVCLMYAECKCRAAGGGSYSNTDGLQQLNDVRTRAGLSPLASYNLDDILDEARPRTLLRVPPPYRPDTFRQVHVGFVPVGLERRRIRRSRRGGQVQSVPAAYRRYELERQTQPEPGILTV